MLYYKGRTELSLSYLIQASLLLDVVPNGERGRGRKRRRRRRGEGVKRVERGGGRRDGEEKEETRCLASILASPMKRGEQLTCVHYRVTPLEDYQQIE